MSIRLPVGPRRYRLQRQIDGRILALDQVTQGRTLLVPSRAKDGRYELSRSGALEVRGGRVSGVVAPAQSSGYQVEAQRDGTIRFRKATEPTWTLAISRLGTVPLHHFAVLDLRDGTLVLVDRDGVWSLSVTPALPGQSTSPANGGPVFELADDFAP